MHILSIGNSFSQDATRYLSQIAKADNFNLNVVNLYIGGCSLYRHFTNMMSDNKAYVLEVNGESTGFLVSLKEALLNREWDYVTLQQASHLSFKYESYQPYITELSEYVSKYAPKAKQLIHQTWSYEQGSSRLIDTAGYSDQKDMFNDIKSAYNMAKESTNAIGIIPSGELFQNLLSSGIEKVHRDTFHASLGVARYALGLLWYKFLTNRDITNNTFCDFDVPISSEEADIAKKCVIKTIDMYL